MTLSLSSTLDGLPKVPGDSLLPRIRGLRAESNRKIVVLDDDPTGTQTVHDTPVLTTWTPDRLADEFSRDSPLFYILTNSRSLSTADAVAITRQIGVNLVEAAARTGRPFTVISRSDSTLRGHYPAEVDALAAAIGHPDAIHVIVPFFLQGGRYTIRDVHYVAGGETLVPAAETPFAKDATFGFTNSNLIDWVVEKHGQGFDPARVHSVGLAELRGGHQQLITERLIAMASGEVCVVNAACLRDVQAFVAAAMPAESSGKRFIYRTAASFVQTYAGLDPQPLLSPAVMINPAAAAGLVVVGSYVPKSTAQLNRLFESRDDFESVVLNVDELLDGRATGHTHEIATRVNALFQAGRHVVLHTSRKLVTGRDADSSLRIGGTVSAAIVEVVRGITVPLRFLIAKGGITSSDVATRGLEVRRAIVLGQILPGVPVWRLQDESRMPGLAYVVFPGNVGDDDALLKAFEILS